MIKLIKNNLGYILFIILLFISMLIIGNIVESSNNEITNIKNNSVERWNNSNE